MNKHSKPEHNSKKNERILNDILFIKICINNINLLELYYFKKYKSEFWKNVCFEYNKYSNASPKTCKQLRDKFKYIYKNYLTVWRIQFSSNTDLNALEISFKQVLDICFNYIGYDDEGTLCLKKYRQNNKMLNGDQNLSYNHIDENLYQQDKPNPTVPNSLIRGSVSLSNLYEDTNTNKKVEEHQVTNLDDFESHPICQSYYNYSRQMKEPFDPEILKSVKFIEELQSNSYTLSDIDNFTIDQK